MWSVIHTESNPRSSAVRAKSRTSLPPGRESAVRNDGRKTPNFTRPPSSGRQRPHVRGVENALLYEELLQSPAIVGNGGCEDRVGDGLQSRTGRARPLAGAPVPVRDHHYLLGSVNGSEADEGSRAAERERFQNEVVV